MQRFIDQARNFYVGTPHRIATHTDKWGENHVIIECKMGPNQYHYLDWIGAEYANEPDEFGDMLPFEDLRWEVIKAA